MDRADRWIGLSDGGRSLEDRLRENFPRVAVIILDFVRPAEKLTGLARLVHPKDEDQAEDQARQWRQLLKDEGGTVLAAVLREWEWPRRPGLREAVDDLAGYLERNAHRMEYPRGHRPGAACRDGHQRKAPRTSTRAPAVIPYQSRIRCRRARLEHQGGQPRDVPRMHMQRQTLYELPRFSTWRQLVFYLLGRWRG
jgi:hypothetical protein